ncbi:DUF4038 domain-containing protein [Neorhizobium sp. P12A]|nr:DUF4038 domain-containing protein [Neorhizobium sp. P12A]
MPPSWAFFCLLAMLISCAGSAGAQDVVFPLHVAEDRRYLEDASGHPFLMTGDAAWSMIAELSREDAEAYLDDRKKRGFNTLLVSLIEHRFSRNAPKNIYGAAPFLAGKDFAAPNEAYFGHAEWILRRAREKGFLVLLAPAYLGSGGGEQGWYQSMKAAGPDVLRSYGEYVGKRFGGLGNIVWIEGGDYDPEDRSLVQALAEGVRQAAPGSLQSFHGNPASAPRSFWGDPDWLGIDSLYTYGDIAAASLDRYRRQPAMPFFLIESRYEGEGANEFDVRRSAYSTLLSGASGQIFGNNPIWHFSAPGLYPSPVTWQEALSSRGAESMSHLRTLFDQVEWWNLKPDLTGALADRSSGKGGVVAASAADGSFALAYVWDAPDISVNLNKLAPSARRARWFDPSSGTFYDASGEQTPAGTSLFRVPKASNASGFSDWVLLISRPQ